MAVIGTLKTFKGGHYFARFAGEPTGAIHEVPLPERAIVPLRQGFRDEPPPVVEVGDEVKTGQIIARSDELICSPVHAPLTGRVSAMEEAPHPVDGETTRVVTIEGGGQDEWVPLARPEGNYERWDEEQMGRVLYEAGVTALGTAGLPTAYHSSVVDPDEIEILVINAVETEPYATGSTALLYQEFDKFVSGIGMLRGALGNIEVHLGIGHNRPRLFQELENRLKYQDWLHLHPLLPKYPQSADEVLIKTLLDAEVPAGELPTSIGVVVCDVQQVVAAYEAVLEGRPFVERVVGMGGSAMDGPANARIRAGTAVGDLLEKGAFGRVPPARLILGGPMRGTSVSDVDTPVTRDTSALVALREPARRLFGGLRPLAGIDSHTNVVAPFVGREKRATTGLNGTPRPCIHCGDCVDVCPQNLFPVWIAQAAERGDLQQAQALDIDACIECGLCSYVCPSKLPLLEQIRRGKGELREERLEG